MISFKFDQTWWRLVTTGILKPIEALRQCIKKIIETETVRNSHAIWIEFFFCESMVHTLNEFTEVKNKQVQVSCIWKLRKLYFKCLKSSHRAVDSPSRTCSKCNWKHYATLCTDDPLQDTTSQMDQEPKVNIFASFGEKNVCYLIVIVYAN